MRPILDDIRSRGLTYVDDGSSPRSTAEQLATDLKMSFAKAKLTLDTVPTPDKIDEALSLLEQQAREQGHAVGIASGLPVTLERIGKWSKELSQRGIVLVPVSAIVPPEPNS